MNAPANLDLGQVSDLLTEHQIMRARLDRLEGLVDPAPSLPWPGIAPAYVRRLALVVADQFECATSDVLGSSRRPEFITPRFVLVWLLRNLATEGRPHSFPVIARALSYVDPTSPMHALKRVNTWRQEPTFADTTDRLLDIARRLKAEHTAELRRQVKLCVFADDAGSGE